MLRGHAIRAGLGVVPQHPVSLPSMVVHPDLVDVGRRLALEADSWEFHTGREAHERDCWRYTSLVLAGWTVLRFTWRQVMHDPDWVRVCLRFVAENNTGGQTPWNQPGSTVYGRVCPP
jgi:very-short-patch-repair endonuclease